MSLIITNCSIYFLICELGKQGDFCHAFTRNGPSKTCFRNV